MKKEKKTNIRYWLKILFCTMLTFNLTAPIQAQPDRPKVAVVLSGGGAKGVAHISALKVIEEAGFPIDIICGTSMGALVGGLYSLGYSTDFLDSLVRAQDWTTLLSDRTDPMRLTLPQRQEQNTYFLIRNLSNQHPQRGGIIRGHNLDILFHQLCEDYLDSISFDSLPIPFACVATDIVSNREVVFHSGHLTEAMRASMAIPGVFTPVRIDNMVLVDGGLKNNYPADIARTMGADIVIGVSVTDFMTRADELGDAISVMDQIINIISRNKLNDNIKGSDIFIHIDVDGYSAASFTPASVDTLLRRGEETTRAFWSQLLALRRKNNIDSVAPHPLQQDVSEKKMDIWITPKSGKPHLDNPVVSAGFRFDSEEMGVLQLGAKMPLHSPVPFELAGTLRLGKQIMADATLSTVHAGPNASLSYTFQNNDLDIYTTGSRTYNVRYHQHTVRLTPLDIQQRQHHTEAGIRWDYFNYNGRLLSTNGSIPSLDDDYYFSYFITTDINTENNWYFPTRGNRLHIALSYRTDNLIGYEGHAGIGDIGAHWRINLPISLHWTMQPMLYARSLLGESSIPLPFSNAVGGEWFAHIVEQQVPFAGVGHLELADRHLAAIQLQMQCNLFKSHYLLLRLAGACQTDELTQYTPANFIVGVQAGYSWNTIIGPLDARIGYTSLTRKPYFYFNIGHIF